MEGVPRDGGVVFQECEPLSLGALPVLHGFLVVRRVPPQQTTLRSILLLFLQLSEVQWLLHLELGQWLR